MGKRLILAIGVLLITQGSWAQTGDAARDDRLVIPGAPADYWTAAALVGPVPEGPQFFLEFIRALEAMEIHDTARLRTVYEYLGKARDTRGSSARSFTVPLPLRAAAWSKLVSSSGSSDLFAAALRDRRARRLLYGAAALNPETRAYLESRPALVEKIHRDHSDVFAVFGRSIAVRDGKVDVPGGAAAAELWELVVQAPVSTPDAFVNRLLAADTGELAALYDAVAHLDAPHQRFMLGSWMPDAARRRARFVTLYRAARAAGRRVAIPHQPFVRTGLDLFAVVSQYRVLEDGQPASPASPAFWRSVFAQVERWPDTEWSAPPSEPSVDATWFVETVMLSARPIWEQAATVAFAQRLWPSTPAVSGAPSANDGTAMVVRLFPKFSTLALALERAGVRDVGVYASALNRAGAMKATGNMYWQRQLLMQYQGAVAIVEQLRRSDRVPAAVAERLIAALSRLEPNQERAYAGAVAGWIAQELLPALGPEAVTADGESESRLLRALSGAPRDRASMVTLTWEDWQYRIDPSIVPLGRLTKIRAMQAGNSLDAVLRVWQAAATLSVSRAAGSRDLTDADSLERVGRTAVSVRALIDTLRQPTPPTDGTRDDAPNVRATLKEIAAALDAVREPRHLSRVPDLTRRMMTVVDVLTGDVLVSLLYAVHIGDPLSPLWLQGDVAYRHDFGLQNRDSLDPDLLSWSAPLEQLGTTWHVRGSLLGLDVGLARLRLPQVSAGGPPAAPVMAPEDQRVFIETVALFDPDRAGDQAMRAVGDAIRAGRQRVTADSRNPQALDRLASIAHLGEWRRRYILPWVAATRPDEAIHVFSLTELYWIGMSSHGPAPVGTDSWGSSAFPLAGCLCLRIPVPQAWEDVSGRIGAVPTLMAEGTVRLAEVMSELKLPAVLARHLMPVLMRGFLDRVQMVHSDDWTAVARYWAAMPRDRVDDAMAQLTVDGPLLAGEAQPAR